MSASLTHAESYTFVTKWGSYSGPYNSPVGQFNYPEGIAVDTSGNVYIADTANNRIQEFNSNGGYLSSFGSYGWNDGNFYFPRDVTVDHLGNIYVVDIRRPAIQEFFKAGGVLRYGPLDQSHNSQYGDQVAPYGIAVDSSGNVYVADTSDNRIVKYDKSGNYLLKWGSKGTTNGQFNNPHSIAIDSLGNVYVTDSGNNRIQKFNSVGGFITSWGSSGSGDRQFNTPWGIDVDSLGNVYVTDSGNNRIQKFDSNGNFITQWGSYGSADGQFSGPSEIAVDSSGNVYVADMNNNRVQKFSIIKNTPTITWNNPANIIYGTPLSNTQLNAIASVPGTYVYTPPAGTILNAGIHKLHVDFTPTNTISYTTASKDVTINVLEKPIFPTATFSTNLTEGYAPLAVQFTDMSKNVTSVKWNFGDGNNSTDENPLHIFSSAGNYTITLTASNANGTDLKSTTITVIEKPVPILPVANFSTNVTKGYTPLSVQFTDLSENVTEYNWNFGDGNNSTDESPVHTFSLSGNYTVNLTASNANGTNSKLAIINVSEKPITIFPVAAFSAKPTSGKAPLNIHFTDKSTGSPTSWKWSFGDGSTKTSQNPTHTYSTVGNYTVKLVATNSAGNNTITKTNYIKVIGKPIAAFSAKPISGTKPLTVTFKDTSIGSPTSWKWSFGDGSTKTSQNPIHTYSKACSYTVKLTATNALGSNTTTKTNYIVVK